MKTFRKTLLSIGTLIVFTLLFIASATEQKVPIQRKIAQFDYAPPSEGFEKSDKVSFILLAPRYAPGFQYGFSEPYVSFTKSMASDFEEMLTARGYTYKGPYPTYDELVYNDKKTSDLILEVEVDMKIMNAGLLKSFVNYSKRTVYYADGEFTIDGKLNLIAYEPFTREKVWTKSVPIAPARRRVTSENKYYDIGSVNGDAAVWNAVVDALQEPYAGTMRQAWNHLDPHEMEVLKKQAGEIKKNSGFIKN